MIGNWLATSEYAGRVRIEVEGCGTKVSERFKVVRKCMNGVSLRDKIHEFTLVPYCHHYTLNEKVPLTQAKIERTKKSWRWGGKENTEYVYSGSRWKQSLPVQRIIRVLYQSIRVCYGITDAGKNP